MKRAESKRKNRPSLDLTGARSSEQGSSMYSVASGVEEDESGEEGGDRASPMRSEMDPSSPQASPVMDVDISGGIGTPVYIASMDNLFEQDAILGKKPRKPSCLAKLLCGAKAAPAAVQPVGED